MILYNIIFLPIVLGLLNYLMPIKFFRSLIIFGQTCVLGLTFYLFLLEDVSHDAPLIHSLGGYSERYAINLVADPISALLILLTSIIFLCALIYAIKKEFLDRQFLLLFLVLESLIFAIFFVHDLFSLYALIEVSTIVVSILIMYKKDARSIYDGMVYLFTNIISMTFFLIGVGMIYKLCGTLDLLQLKIIVPTLPSRDLILPYAFMMTAVGLKSALMPVFSWLPKAHGTHSAPYIVSAVLSGLYVKSSIYIFIRMQNVFGPSLDTHVLFMVLGFLTAILAGILAISQYDIKLILAYSTVSQIGLIIFGLSMDNTYSYYGAIYHIVNHSIFKTLLFLCAGLIIDRYNTRDMRNIRGVFTSMPLLSLAMIMAMLGVTGAPFFNGSISKYLIQKGIIDNYVEYIFIFMNLFTFAYMIRLSQIFFGYHPRKFRINIHQQVVLISLGLICLIGGLFGHDLVGLFFNIHVEWTFFDYIEKTAIYIISFLITALFYKYVFDRIQFFKVIRELELSFNELVYTIVLLFSGLLGYLMITIV